MLTSAGGDGPPIVLLHGLMGRGRTWRRQVPWLRQFGHVFVVDAAGHGRPAPAELTTEAFVADLATLLDPGEPAVLIGHSMGALHGWCYAAEYPDRVRALVVEDMAPDFRGRTADGWAALIRAWPAFDDDDAVRAYFGDVAGQYFLDAFDRTDDGYRLHGDPELFRSISAEWGRREFWTQWDAVACPTLVIEAEHTITPVGQMREMVDRHPDARYEWVAGAGHLVHDEQPERYRAAVTAFLRSLA